MAKSCLYAAALLFASTSFAVAQAPAEALTLPAEVKGRPGEFLTIKATTTAAMVRWVLIDDGPAIFPPELLADKRTAVLVSMRAGKFRVLAYACVNGEASPPAICQVIVGDPTPKPPPPTPPPTPPAPADPLTAKFQAAYNTSPDVPALKVKQRDLLVGLYQAMAEHAQEEGIKTTGDLKADLQKTAAKLLLPNCLIEVRKLIAAEVGPVLGENPAAALDADTRRKAVAVFARVASSLSSVK